MKNDIIQAVKEAIRAPYAWPGGYQKSIICNDGAALCPECAKKNFRSIVDDTKNNNRTGWDVAGVDILWEGGNTCENCNVNLDAYPEEKETEPNYDDLLEGE